MKKFILAVAISGAFASISYAQDVVVAEHNFTGNAAVATDYRFRGISQTYEKPAFQGGFDYAHSSGFYVGNWNSNVSGNSFIDGSIEMDFYTGFKFAVAPEILADVGVLHYYYPGADAVDYDTTELYVAGTYKSLSAKYSYAVSDFFGLDNSDGSAYFELNAAFEVADKTTLGFHVGRQNVRNVENADYTDYKISLARDFGFATIGLAVVGTNADDTFYSISDSSGQSRELGDTAVVLSLSKTF